MVKKLKKALRCLQFVLRSWLNIEFVAQWSVRLERMRQVREGVRHDGRYDQGFFFLIEFEGNVL